MKKFVLSILMALTIVCGFAAQTGLVYADASTDAAKAQVCEGVSGQAGGTCGTGGVDINAVIRGVLNFISVIAGIAAFVMVMISGFRYITSSGDPQAVSGAKRTLIYAIVGLVVVASAQLIVHFVLLHT